jgi:hypothetical protein
LFYLDFFQALERHHVRYVLVGGLAVTLHGVERATMDIDLSLAMDADNLEAMLHLARELGLEPVLPVPIESIVDPVQLEDWRIDRHMEVFALRSPERAGVTIDLLVRPAVPFDLMESRAVVFNVAETPVRVASIDDLIALKRAVGRPIDLGDIGHLERIRGGR